MFQIRNMSLPGTMCYVNC